MGWVLAWHWTVKIQKQDAAARKSINNSLNLLDRREKLLRFFFLVNFMILFIYWAHCSATNRNNAIEYCTHKIMLIEENTRYWLTMFELSLNYILWLEELTKWCIQHTMLKNYFNCILHITYKVYVQAIFLKGW